MVLSGLSGIVMPFVGLLAVVLFATSNAGCLLSLRSFTGSDITITAEPIEWFEINNPSRRQFGELEFVGGLVLNAAHKAFGGISALRVSDDGEHFLALSDRAYWLRGRIVYENDRPTGITDAEMSPVLNAEGNPAPDWDTESIAVDGAAVYVSLERINGIRKFNFGEKGTAARGQEITVPDEMKLLPENQGLEALEFVPRSFPLGGALIAFSERGLDDDGNLQSFIIGGPKPGTFSVRRTDDYDITDAALLPDGDLLMLDRKFSLLGGVAARIRRLPLESIRPGALVDGPVIFEADFRFRIDNMESLSVHRSPSGRLILTLMSDDNYSPMQRTLLLQFVLKEPARK
ncbi:MAG TPA: esterase-like activity of phytase family protein [Acidobacteriota bacterium]|nr:esterase-like activity of phytase family protein [Acidobacteriota bacterium]